MNVEIPRGRTPNELSETIARVMNKIIRSPKYRDKNGGLRKYVAVLCQFEQDVLNELYKNPNFTKEKARHNGEKKRSLPNMQKSNKRTRPIPSQGPVSELSELGDSATVRKSKKNTNNRRRIPRKSPGEVEV